MINDTSNQRTLSWHRARLGHFTGSRISELMKTGRKKDEIWSETAKTYIYQVAAERMFNTVFLNDDDVFQDYLDQTSFTTRAMQWGIEQESAARQLYARMSHSKVAEVGSCEHDTIPFFAASPDGLVDDDKILEVKCPNLATHMRYIAEICDGPTLKAVKPEYYWQMMAEMACTGRTAGVFVSYCAWLTCPIHIVDIERNEEDVAAMEERVLLANKYIEETIANKKS